MNRAGSLWTPAIEEGDFQQDMGIGINIIAIIIKTYSFIGYDCFLEYNAEVHQHIGEAIYEFPAFLQERRAWRGGCRCARAVCSISLHSWLGYSSLPSL